MTILTTCTLTFIDLNEIHIGAMPINPVDNELWFDTELNILKKYDASNEIWEIVNDYSQDIADALKDLQVSSRNLLAATSYESDIICNGSMNQAGGQYDFVKTIDYVKDIKDKEITLAFDWEIVIEGEPSGSFRAQTTGDEQIQIGDIITLSNSNYYGTCVFTTTLITTSNITGINFRADGVTGTLKITHPRLFCGSKDLGWSQAPEDIDSQFETIIKKQADGVYISVTDKDNDIKSLVTFDSKKVVINSTNIDLKGYVTISSLSDPNSTTTIDGNLIETDTLSANKVKTGKLQGKNSNSYFNLDDGTFSLSNSTQSLMTFDGTSLTFQNNVNYNLDKDDFSSNLDWIKTWTEGSTTINSKQVMSPRAFFGTVNASKQATGISLGGALNKIYETEGTYSGIDEGLAGYKLGTKTFHFKSDGTLLIGPNTTGNYISWDGSALTLRATSMNIGVDSVATTTNVSTSVDALKLKFTQNSAYNLIRNSTGASGNTNGWTHNGTSLGVGSNDSIGSNCKTFMYLDNGTTTSEKYAYGSRFKLKPNTKYTLTGYFLNYTTCPSFDVWLLSSTTLSDTDTTTGYTNAQAFITGQTTSGVWKKITGVITTPASTISGYIRVDNNGYNSSGTGANRIHWNALMLSEGELETIWNPHPSETYDGITSIDKDGIVVTASNVKSKTTMNANGFKITKTGTTEEDVFSVNSDGTLNIKGNINGGTINLGTDKFVVDSSGNVTTAGNVNLGGNVTTAGNVTLGGTITASGNITATNLKLNGGGININNAFIVDNNGNVTTTGTFSLSSKATVPSTTLSGSILSNQLDSSITSDITSAKTTSDLLAQGLNKWMITAYDITGAGYVNTTIPTFNMLANRNIKFIKEILDSATSSAMNLGDNYIGHAKTNVYLDSDYSLTISLTTDDAGAIYLNGVLVTSTVSCTAKSITLNLKAGWNTVEVLYLEISGGDGFVFSPKFSATTQIKRINAYEISSASISSNLISESKSLLDDNKSNWSNAYNRVLEWASDAITGSTTINGGLIQTNTITAEKIAIGDFTNYVSDPNFENNVYKNNGYWSIDTTQKHSGTKSLKLSAGASGNTTFDLSKKISVRNGDKIYVEWWAYKDSANQGANINVYVANADGTLNVYDIVGNIIMSSSSEDAKWIKYSYIGTVNTDGYATVQAKLRSSNTLTGNWYFDDINVRKMTSGELIVDGTITTGHINTTGLDASVIKAGTILADRIDADIIVSKVNGATTTINGDKITTGTITAEKLAIVSRDSFSVNPNFINWTSTYPYGTSSWSSSTGTKVAVDSRNVLQYEVTTATTQMGLYLNNSYFNPGLNLDGMQYIGLEVKYRLTSGTSPAGACMLFDIYYTDSTYERLTLSLKSINSSVTTDTWYVAKKVFKVSNIHKTFKTVSGYLLANWSTETNTIKTIQFASANAYACTEQDYLTQTWSNGTEINGDKISTGIISASSGGSYLNLNDGSMLLGTTSGTNYLQWTGSALNIKANSLSIGGTTAATTTNVSTAKTEAISEAVGVKDTRSTNEAPSWYMTNYPKRTVQEFKSLTVLGLTGSDTYGNLETMVPWGDSSGGYPIQTFYGNGNEIFTRKGTSTTAWSAWTRKVNASQSDVFNTLTNNGTNQGIYIESGNVYLNASMIKTGSLLAERIAIYDFTNYAELNPDTLSRWGFVSEADTSASNNPWFKKSTIARDNQIGSYYKCNGGETLRIKADISTTVYGQSTSGGTATATARSLGIMIFAKSNTGTMSYLTNDDLRVTATSTTTATIATVNGFITLPDTAREFSVYIQIEGYPTFTGTLKARNVLVTRMANGELIVDGSIKSNHIDTDSIKAEHIDVNTITSEHVDINGNGFSFYSSKTLDPDTNTYHYGDTIFSIKNEDGQNSSVTIKPDSFILEGRNAANNKDVSIVLKDNILTIDASAITTGVLNASLITGGELDASLIKGGTIKGDQINTEDFTVVNNTTNKSTFAVKGGKVFVSASDFIITPEEFDPSSVDDNSSLASELLKEKNRVDEYIRLSSGTIELGQKSGNYKATLTNNALTFYEKGSAVSWITGNTMYITNNRCTDTLVIGPTSGGGRYIWDYQDNGHLNLSWLSN